eukprot:351002-Chlamydomonas_euryale.AAC.17
MAAAQMCARVRACLPAFVLGVCWVWAVALWNGLQGVISCRHSESTTGSHGRPVEADNFREQGFPSPPTRLS